MKPIQTFTVSPALPPTLKKLQDIAYNLRWSWNHTTLELFRRMDRELWETTYHNPIQILGSMSQQKLEELSQDEGFMDHYERVHQDLESYLNNKKTWYKRTFGEASRPLFAYFSAEFGISECVPIYSGGLGVLAGDHMKSASELGLPLVGVGLLYQQGYFRQYLNADGWQQELYPENDFYNMPIQLQRNAAGDPILINIELPGRTIVAQIWKLQVGRIAIYLLDTNVPSNSQADQDITDQLYGGDREMRLKQEIVLGIGGLRALTALKIAPTAFHMNEGHSAFLALERIRLMMKNEGLTYQEAVEISSYANVFTTHTPVEAGHDYFPPELMKAYFRPFYEELGLSEKEFLALGRKDAFDDTEFFCMTVLAMRLAKYRNAVSALHKQVSQKMWNVLWPDLPQREVPIDHITNGIHANSFLSREMADLFDRYLGPRWRTRPDDQSVWRAIEEIPALELWRTHEKRRQRLVAFTRRKLQKQIKKLGGRPTEITAAREVLNPDVLTIGFARRFATYKRATLIMHDEERLRKLLSDPYRPIQIIFAGKAHPKDDEGKKLIRQIVHFARDEKVRSRIAFLEDYDLSTARYLVQGVDVWLNTPRRPREASGTSGMKAAMNGALNLSTLDGWWDEAYEPGIGWALGRDETYEDFSQQNEIESNALYDLLEEEIIPMFYERGREEIPRAWVNCMKASMTKLCPMYNTSRMVHDYTEKFYQPATVRYQKLARDNFSEGRRLASWKINVANKWDQVEVHHIHTNGKLDFRVGDPMDIKAQVRLGELSPDDVSVELYMGLLDTKNNFIEPETVQMKYQSSAGDGTHLFVAESIRSKNSGKYGFTIRVLPKHDDLTGPNDLGVIRWAKS